MRRRMMFLLPALLPVLGLAQPMRGPRPWWEGQVAKDLNLSDAQTKQILQTREDFRARMMETRQAVNQAEQEVQAAFNEDPVDQTKANEAISRLAAAHAEATRAVSEMELKFRMILTAQQWQDLKQKQGGWPGGRGRRRPTGALPTNQK